jgi:hypothetical protein
MNELSLEMMKSSELDRKEGGEKSDVGCLAYILGDELKICKIPLNLAS